MLWRSSVLAVNLVCGLGFAHAAPDLDLTPAERVFIAEHPVIVVGGEMDWPPLDYVEDGEYRGAARDYLDEISALTGLQFEMVTGHPWADLMTLIRRREIDMLPMMYWTEARGREFNLTNPYITVRHYAFVMGDPAGTRSLADLYGRTVAVPAGYASAERLALDHPSIKLLSVATTLAALDAVVTGRADAVIEQLAGISYHAQRNGVTGLRPAFPVDLGVNDVQMAVRKDWPLLRDILQKALDAIPAERATSIMTHWTGSEDTARSFLPETVQLNATESDFLAQKAGLVACVNTARLPYEGYRDNTIEGISGDYTARFAATLGVPITPLPAADWQQIRADLTAGRCDFAPHANLTGTDAQTFVVSQPYGSGSLALATRSNERFFTAIDALVDFRIGVVSGYVDLPALRSEYPNIEFVEVATLKEGLKAVVRGRLFGLVDYVPVLNYAIQNQYDERLKISGKFSQSAVEFGVAVHRDKAQLTQIFDKVLRATSAAQRQTIHNKWVAVTIEKQTSDRLLQWALLGAAMFLAYVITRALQQRHRHREEIRAKNDELMQVNNRLEKQSRDAMHLALHDTLTGLSNRAKLMADLEHAVQLSKRTGSKVALLFLDLDRFKYVNDSLGHDVGDALLIVAADTIKAQLRETDSLFRLGGDEFVVLLEALTGQRSPAVVAMRVVNSFARPFSIEGHTVNIGASIGIAVAPDDTLDLNTLLKYADNAMYAAKDSGGNAYRFYQPRFLKNAQRRLGIESALQDAVQNEEFSLVYQPIVDLRRRRVVKAEALLRWDNPQLGHVPPDRFIPIAEENGLIVEIGQWVLREACRDMLDFCAGGINLDAISVNVSSVELTKENIAARFAAITQEEGVLPAQIDIEITERSVLEKRLGHETELANLRLNGHCICVDDFGIGYSSLSYMKKLPLNIIKVDRSFISNLPDDQNDVEITSAIISLSHNLGYEVVAEGCETVEQFNFLMAKGCNFAQGYFFSRPVNAEALPRRVAELNQRLQSMPALSERMLPTSA